MPQPRRSQPPQQPVPPSQPPATGLGTGPAATAATTGLATTGVVAAQTAQAILTAGKVAAILAAMTRFFVRKRETEIPFIYATIRARYPNATDQDIAMVVRQEMDREEIFQRRALARTERDLNLANAISDTQTRNQKIRGVMERERRYIEMRQKAMADRVIAAQERTLLRRRSPRGAYWHLSPHVKEHTLDCLAMGGKFWPWEVLDIIHPPLHPGCPCMLYGEAEAKRAGWLPQDFNPEPTGSAMNRAKTAIETARRRMEEHAIEEASFTRNHPAGGGGGFDPHLHPRDRRGKWIKRLFHVAGLANLHGQDPVSALRVADVTGDNAPPVSADIERATRAVAQDPRVRAAVKLRADQLEMGVDMTEPPAPQPTVRMYHGTSTLSSKEGIAPRDPVELAHWVEDDLGLPRDSVLHHGAFMFSKDRATDENVYLALDQRTAQSYADARSEMLTDALTAAYRVLHPPPDFSTPEEGKAYNAAYEAWRDDWFAKHGAHPRVLAVDVPLSALAASPVYQRYVKDAELARRHGSKREVLSPQEWIDAHEGTGTLMLPGPIPAEWVTPLMGVSAPEVNTGFPDLDAAIREWMAKPNVLAPESNADLNDMRDPRNAFGQCEVVADSLTAFLKERGFNAYTARDEVGMFYPDAKPSDKIGAGEFSYPEHAATEIYDLPGMGVRTVTIDFTAAQYGFHEFPKIMGVDMTVAGQEHIPPQPVEPKLPDGIVDAPDNVRNEWLDRRNAWRAQMADWSQEVGTAVMRGDVSVEQAEAAGWKPEWDRIRPLPDTLYHATTALDAVASEGLRSRHDLEQVDGAGLGSMGTERTVSFTDDPQIAKDIVGGILTLKAVLRDETPPGMEPGDDVIDTLYRDAESGRSGHQGHWGNYLMSLAFGPPSTRTADWERGLRVDFDMSDWADVEAVRNFRERKTRVGASYTEWKEAGLPSLAATAEEIRAVGWEPVLENGWENAHGVLIYSQARRPMTDDERRQSRVDFARAFLMARESQGNGPTDPFFIGSDFKALEEMDPAQVGIVEVHPKPGTMGYAFAGPLGEWRVYPGALDQPTTVEANQPPSEPQRPLWAAEVGRMVQRIRDGEPPVSVGEDASPLADLIERLRWDADPSGVTKHEDGTRTKTWKLDGLLPDDRSRASFTVTVQFDPTPGHPNMKPTGKVVSVENFRTYGEHDRIERDHAIPAFETEDDVMPWLAKEGMARAQELAERYGVPLRLNEIGMSPFAERLAVYTPFERNIILDDLFVHDTAQVITGGEGDYIPDAQDEAQALGRMLATIQHEIGHAINTSGDYRNGWQMMLDEAINDEVARVLAAEWAESLGRPDVAAEIKGDPGYYLGAKTRLRNLLDEAKVPADQRFAVLEELAFAMNTNDERHKMLAKMLVYAGVHDDIYAAERDVRQRFTPPEGEQMIPLEGEFTPAIQMAVAPSESPKIDAFLRSSVEMRKAHGMGPKGWRHGSLEELALNEGRSWTPQPLPEDARPWFGEPKMCFKNATDAVLGMGGKKARPDWRYVEGYVKVKDVPFPIEHAWAVDDDDRVIELTLVNPGEEYRGTVLTNDQLRAAVLRTQHYGVLDDMQNDWPFLQHGVNPSSMGVDGIPMAQRAYIAEGAMVRGGLVGRVHDIPVGLMKDTVFGTDSEISLGAYGPIPRELSAWLSEIAGMPVRVVASTYWEKEGIQGTANHATGTITVRPYANDLTLLHEVAHLMTPGHGHDEVWMDTAARLYGEHISPEAERTFRSLAFPPMGVDTAYDTRWAPGIQSPKTGPGSLASMMNYPRSEMDRYDRFGQYLKSMRDGLREVAEKHPVILDGDPPLGKVEYLSRFMETHPLSDMADVMRSAPAATIYGRMFTRGESIIIVNDRNDMIEDITNYGKDQDGNPILATNTGRGMMIHEVGHVLARAAGLEDGDYMGNYISLFEKYDITPQDVAGVSVYGTTLVQEALAELFAAYYVEPGKLTGDLHDRVEAMIEDIDQRAQKRRDARREADAATPGLFPLIISGLDMTEAKAAAARGEWYVHPQVKAAHDMLDAEVEIEESFREWLHPRGRGGQWIDSPNGVTELAPGGSSVTASGGARWLADSLDGLDAGGVSASIVRREVKGDYARVTLRLERDGEQVGLAQFRALPGHLASIDNVYVREDARDSGIATHLLTSFYDACRANGVERVKLETVDVGGYYWAVTGYEWSGDPQRAQQDILFAAKQDGRWAQIEEHAPGAARTLERLIAEGHFKSEASLAAWGRDSSWTGPDERPWWPGKRLMVGAAWKGEREP